jgi:hypothetical protein
MKFSKNLKKKDKELYIKICTKIWGCVPIDVDWATRTNIYKSALKKEIELVDKHETKSEKN